MIPSGTVTELTIDTLPTGRVLRLWFEIVHGRSTNPVGQTGARIVHLGDIVPALPVPAADGHVESAED